MKWATYPLGDVTQWYAQNPKLYESMGLKGHNGIDIVRPWGEHLYAVEGGVVCDLKDDPSGYGMHVRILSTVKARGEYREWTYGHLSHINVKLGEKVAEGQYIGNMGNTGFVVSGSTPYWGSNPYAGTHLHLGCRDIIGSSTGWKYPYEGSPKVRVVDYENGYKGQKNVLNLFWDKKSKAAAVRAVADIRKDSVLYQLAELLRKLKL